MKYALRDLLDIPTLRELLDSLDEVHGMPSAIVDREGNILTATAWQDICTKFHRVNPETEKKCIESDTHIKGELDKNMSHVIYRCPLGLVDAAIPIIIEGEYLGSIFTGQLFIEPPDEAYFIEQARQYGFNETEYLTAMRKVPCYTEEQLHKNLTFMHQLAQMLAKQGLQAIRQREILELLQKSEERLRSYVELSPHGVFITDEHGYYTDVNPAASVITGYTTHELLEMNISEMLPPGSLQWGTNNFKQLVETGRSSGESAYLRKNGETGYWTLEAVKLSATSFMGMVTDITKRKQAEEERSKLQQQLLQAQKLESVGRLAGGVAHDFNNLLTVILGGAYLALMELNPGQPLYDYITSIQKAAEKSADLTQQLLAFARKQTFMPIVLDLNETIENMIKMLQRLIGEDIELKWQPKSNLWPVKADPSQIDQILANLCVNARDSISDIGKITIQTGNYTVDEGNMTELADAIPGEYVHISICDNGCGMDTDTLTRIFEPFFTTKGEGKGTGLGLATVYGVVRQNNGFINVYSEPGLGTTFTIYLPRYASNAEQMFAKEDTEPPAPRGLETILLVEDEPSILNMTATILTKQGYKVLEANTPAEAIRLANEHSETIDLLITDVIMPEMNGKDLANRLMTLYPEFKCLYMSGYTADIISHHGVFDEDTNFIQKPFSLPDLSNKVRAILNG